jgi:ParB family transcriptional regulator, chromosome partitioning protein
MAQQYGLGRGLASLIPPKKIDDEQRNEVPREQGNAFSYEPQRAEVPQQKNDEQVVKKETGMLEVFVTDIVPNPHQPRVYFDEAKLEELASSIREHGVLQPLVVTRVGDRYELIAGERRFQASKKAGLTKVPVVVREATEQTKLELAIIENIQRHNLNPIEEAKAYQRLLHEFGLHQEEVAKKMGKSRSAVANSVRLLQLPIEIQRAVSQGKISEGHAKALLGIENKEKQRAIFELILSEELTVRETENRVRSVSVKAHTRIQKPEHIMLNAKADELTQLLGTKVKINPSGKGGRVVLEYYSEEELESLLGKLITH